jgi:hypothetical protein
MSRIREQGVLGIQVAERATDATEQANQRSLCGDWQAG